MRDFSFRPIDVAFAIAATIYAFDGDTGWFVAAMFAWRIVLNDVFAKKGSA